MFERKSKLSRIKKRALQSLTMAMMAIVMAVPAFAAEGDVPAFSINFDVGQMFAIAQPFIDALMPVVYITAGLGLAFMIIGALKNAFR